MLRFSCRKGVFAYETRVGGWRDHCRAYDFPSGWEFSKNWSRMDARSQRGQRGT